MSILSVFTRHPRVDRLKAANIGLISTNFDKHFRNMKLRTDAPKKELVFHDLERPALDQAIRAKLSANHVISIDQFLDLIEAQKNGQDGPLLVNGYANIAYIEDENGTVWAVDAGFDAEDGYWLAEAFSVESPSEWFAGDRVVSGK
jgi:hypothetical protein